MMNLSSGTAAAKKNAKLIRAAADSLSSRVQPPRLSQTRKAVDQVVKQRSDPGKKMMNVGTALLIMPEPITSVAAVPVLIVGRALSSKSGTNVTGIYEELTKTMKIISSTATLS